ncbi:MAG: hypothetical protein MK077_01870 [Phycisphaerales bacterium]|nr:hypothetical protein [Phycisphaerales bacterium]
MPHSAASLAGARQGVVELVKGLDRWAKELDPELVARVLAWKRVPGLSSLLESLQSQKQRVRFLDLWTEAIIADRLVEQGCQLEAEVQTPLGRTCDFQVRFEGLEWYLHVKRVDDEKAEAQRLAISPRLRVLEQIERPFIVRIRWRHQLADKEMQQLVVRASEFLQLARLGDELTVRDESGLEVGAVRVVGPWDGPTVSLVIGLPDGFIDQSQRIRRLLDKAYRQFMPRAHNIVLVAGSRLDVSTDFEAALLGSTEERWDAHPPRGARVAWGRAADGFWTGPSRPESRICGWCRVDPLGQRADNLHTDLHFREDPCPDDTLRSQVARLLVKPMKEE